MAVSQGSRRWWLTSRLINGHRQVNCFRHYYVHVNMLYLRREGTIHVYLWTCLPITTTLVGEWLNSSIYHGDINVYCSQWIDDHLWWGRLYVTWWSCILHKKFLETLSHSYMLMAYKKDQHYYILLHVSSYDWNNSTSIPNSL